MSTGSVLDEFHIKTNLDDSDKMVTLVSFVTRTNFEWVCNNDELCESGTRGDFGGSIPRVKVCLTINESEPACLLCESAFVILFLPTLKYWLSMRKKYTP